MLAGGQIPAAARPPRSLVPDACAFFLDLDGTLLELAPHPDAVAVDAELRELLQELTRASGGAVALISGRSIATLDTLFQPLRLPAAGTHGFERRNHSGTCAARESAPLRALAAARQALAPLLARHPGLMLEDKGYALAVHYRQAPQLESAVLDAVRALAAGSTALRVQRGHCVAELLPAGVNKAHAVAEFMREHPFAGRMPVYVGDDLTDEPAFEWVNAAGGVSVGVKLARATAARARLDSVAEVHAWLRALLRTSR